MSRNLVPPFLRVLFVAALAAAPVSAQNWASQAPPYGRPDATIDLRTKEGAQLVKGEWKYSDAKIVEVDSKGPGADLKPSGAPVRTYDYAPHAGVANFDDSAWPVVDPTTLDARRGNGKVSFNWYRIRVTLPEKVATFPVMGATVSFEIVIDDYAEIWVNGSLPSVLGQSGGTVVKGWNAPNKVILTNNAKPGQQFEIAVFGFNGPISRSPENFIWVKSATVDLYKPGPSSTGILPVETKIIRLDPGLDSIVPADTKIEKLAGGFLFTEGPVWFARAAICCLAIPTTTSSTAGPKTRESPSSARTVVTPARTSASMGNPARTGSPSMQRVA